MRLYLQMGWRDAALSDSFIKYREIYPRVDQENFLDYISNEFEFARDCYISRMNLKYEVGMLENLQYGLCWQENQHRIHTGVGNMFIVLFDIEYIYFFGEYYIVYVTHEHFFKRCSDSLRR